MRSFGGSGRRLVAVAAGMVMVAGSGTSALAARSLGPLTTVTTLTSGLNPSEVGQPVTFTATVTKSSGIPQGTVTFAGALPLTLAGPVPLNANGVASVTTSDLAAGSYSVVATYAPSLTDALLSLASASTVVTQVVNAASGGGGGGGDGGGDSGGCTTGQTTPTPTIAAPAAVVGPTAVLVHGAAVAGDNVALYQHATGDATFTKVATTAAGATGAYAFTRTVRNRTTFVARDNGACGPADSARAVTTVAIDPRLRLRSPHPGKLRMRVATRPVAAGETARFFRKHKVGAPTLLAKVTTSATGVAHKKVKAKSGKRYRVFVTVTAPVGNEPGRSKAAAIRIA